MSKRYSSFFRCFDNSFDRCWWIKGNDNYFYLLIESHLLQKIYNELLLRMFSNFLSFLLKHLLCNSFLKLQEFIIFLWLSAHINQNYVYICFVLKRSSGFFLSQIPRIRWTGIQTIVNYLEALHKTKSVVLLNHAFINKKSR